MAQNPIRNNWLLTDSTEETYNLGDKMTDLYRINDDLLDIRYTNERDNEEMSENINELVGVFTTANARVMLYELFESVGLDNVIYADTDSVIYIETDENEYFYKNCNSALGDYDCELKKTKRKDTSRNSSV